MSIEKIPVSPVPQEITVESPRNLVKYTGAIVAIATITVGSFLHGPEIIREGRDLISSVTGTVAPDFSEITPGAPFDVESR